MIDSFSPNYVWKLKEYINSQIEFLNRFNDDDWAYLYDKADVTHLRVAKICKYPDERYLRDLEGWIRETVQERIEHIVVKTRKGNTENDEIISNGLDILSELKEGTCNNIYEKMILLLEKHISCYTKYKAIYRYTD
jgi:hypothetical protein